MSVHTSGSAPLRVYSSVWQMPCSRIERQSRSGVDIEHLACVENLDSDLVCARGFHLDILELEWLACTPAYGSLALDDLSFSFRHDSASGSHSTTSRVLGIPDCFREAGPFPVVYLNVLPKHLLQACKYFSLIRTIVVPQPSPKKQKLFS